MLNNSPARKREKETLQSLTGSCASPMGENMRVRTSSAKLLASLFVIGMLQYIILGDLKASPPSGRSACLVWQSHLTAGDLGKTGANGLFASWQTVKSRTSRNLHRVSGGRAPDGSLAYKFFFSGNDNPGSRGPVIAFDQTGPENLRNLYGEFKIYLPAGYWSAYSGGQKLVRLWAGAEGDRFGAGYGRAIINDPSSTVAVVPNRFRLYSYFRNRGATGGIVIDPSSRQHWQMPEGRWITLAQEIRANDPGQRNGHLSFFIDGREVARRDGIDWLRDGGAGFQGFAFTGWAGGARVVDQNYWMKDFKLYELGC